MIELLRHDQTLWTRQDRLQGHADSPSRLHGGRIEAVGTGFGRAAAEGAP